MHRAGPTPPAPALARLEVAAVEPAGLAEQTASAAKPRAAELNTTEELNSDYPSGGLLILRHVQQCS